MLKIYRIKLSSEERIELNELINSTRKVSAIKVLKAQAILLADESDEGESCADARIVEAIGIRP